MRHLCSGNKMFSLLLIGLFVLALARRPDAFQEDTIEVWRGHERAVTDVAFMPGGAAAVSCGLDGTVRIWDAGTGRMQKILCANGDEVFALKVSRDGSRIVTAEYKGQVRVHSKEGISVWHLTGFLGWSADVALSPDSSKLAAWSMDGNIWIWDLETGERIKTLKGRKNKWGMALAWSPSGNHLAAGRIAITVWDIESGKMVQSMEGHKGFIRDLEFSPDGRWLASASMDKTVRVWELKTGKALYDLKPQGLVIYLKSGPVTNPIRLPMTAVAFSPGGQLLATGGADRVVRLWDAATGKALREFKGHLMSVTSVVFSPDGARLLSSSLDRTIRVWEVD